MNLTFRRLVLGFAVLLSSMGNGGGGCGSHDTSVLGPPTGAMCPSASPLTYANFGQAFMDNYCTRCHSSQLVGGARNGAPAYHDFDTQLGVQQVADHIDEAAGAGPDAENDSMPPDGTMPTLEERQKLAEWIACGAP